MRERAAMIGGTLDIQSASDYGTAVILEVPC
jgi:signal transduction histidine kinase